MNEFGRLFKISIYGESHSDSIGIILSGVPVGLDLSADDFIADLNCRRAGALGTTRRTESDLPIISSGVFNGKTTGAPILIQFKNENANSNDYPDSQKQIPRPGHSDFTASMKYFGFNDYRGGGHFSGRMTLALVAAGVVAKKIIPYSISSKILSIGGQSDYQEILQKAISEGDSLGGIVETTISNVDIGLGEPFFDSIESIISHLIFSIPGAKAIEFGAGIASAAQLGSEYVDSIIDENGTTRTNNSGGINGGISNGNDIIFRTAFHPTSSIAKPIDSFDFEKLQPCKLTISGRHDACYVLRVPVVASAVAACVMADLFLIRKAYILEK